MRMRYWGGIAKSDTEPITRYGRGEGDKRGYLRRARLPRTLIPEAKYGSKTRRAGYHAESQFSYIQLRVEPDHV